MCACPELKVISRYNEFIVGIFAAKQYVSCFIGTTLRVFERRKIAFLTFRKFHCCGGSRPPVHILGSWIDISVRQHRYLQWFSFRRREITHLWSVGQLCFGDLNSVSHLSQSVTSLRGRRQLSSWLWNCRFPCGCVRSWWWRQLRLPSCFVLYWLHCSYNLVIYCHVGIPWCDQVGIEAAVSMACFFHSCRSSLAQVHTL